MISFSLRVGPLTKGKMRIFYDLSPEYPVVGVVGLGPPDAGYDDVEELNLKNENIRGAIAIGCKTLRDLGSISEIDVDGCGPENAMYAAEGANLGLFYFDQLKSERFKKPVVKVNLLTDKGAQEAWDIGCIHAEAQNLARVIMETPANLMTPTIVAQLASDTLSKV